jgi:hypothetical protein
MTQSISLKPNPNIANGSEVKTKRHEMTQGKVGGQKKILGGFGYATTDQVLV